MVDMPERIWVDTSTIKLSDLGGYSEGVDIYYNPEGDPDDVEYVLAERLQEDLKYYELVQAANAARLALAGSIDHQIAVDLLDSVLGEIGEN